MTFNLNNKTYELILLIISGSRLYGNSTPESDWDYRGIVIEPLKDRIGILPGTNQLMDGKKINQILKSKGIIEYDSDDIVLYELGKFADLAKDCNPNIMDILNIDLKDPALLYYTDKGKELLDNKDLFLSSKIKHTFSGYAQSQLRRIKSHYKYLVRYPRINELVQILSNNVSYDVIKNNFSGELANFINPSVENGLSYNELVQRYEFIKDYRKPQLIDYCNAYDLKHSKLEKNKWIDYNIVTDGDITLGQSMRLDEFLKTEASFRKISNSIISVHDRGLGIFSKEGNLKGNDYENIGEFKFLLKIDTMNYKTDVDAIKKMYHWKVNRNEKRNELEAKFGYDVKHASHLLRLLRQCIKILKTGVYNPRLEGTDLKEVKETRAGKYTYDELIELSSTLDNECIELYKTTKLPKKSNIKKINDLVVELRLWK